MKKILLFLFGVIASLSAMAATGNYFISGSFNGWDHAKLQFQQTGTTYSITLDGTGLQPFSGEFLICGGTLGTPDWTDKIGGVSNIEPDKTYTYTVGGGNFSVKGVIAYPLTVTFNTSDKTIKITGAAAENEYSTVYVVGDFGDAWDESRTDGPLTLKSGTNNVWEGDVTFTGASNYFKLKAGAYIYGTGGADIEVEMGESYTASQSGNAFNVGSGTYHFNFVLDKNAPTGVLTVTGNGNPPTPPTPPTPGDYTGWYFNLGSPANEAAGNEWFTGVAVPEDGIVEYGDIALGNDLFKIKIWNGTDDLYYGTADGMVEPNTPTVLTEVTVMEEMHVTGAVAGSVYNVKYDCGTNTLTLTKVGDDPNPPTPPTPGDYTGWYFNLGSPANEAAGNEWFTGVPVPEDGIVEYGDIALGDDLFKIKIWNGTADLYYGTADGMVEPNTPTVLTEVTVMEEMHVTGAVAGSVYNVKYDCGTNTLTLTKVGDDPNPPTPPTPGDVPTTLYLIGNIENCLFGMNPAIGVEMTKSGNVFTCESVILDAYQGNGWFSFCSTLATEGLEDEEAWGMVNSENRFGPAVSDTEVGSAPVPFETFVAGVNASACTSWKIAANEEGKKYKFVMDFDNTTLTVTTVSGVNTINAELEGEAVYFNLQGQRVDNPANGIFVRVLNGKAEKIMK